MEAGQRYQEALARFHEIGDRQGQVRALNNLGIVYWGMGDYGAARKHFSQALAIWRDLDDKQGQGIGLGNLGQIAGELGQYEDARNYYQEALVLLREVGDRHGQAIDLLNLGVIYGCLEDFTASQARQLFHDVGDPQSEAATLTYRGYTLLDQGAHDEAIASLETALALFHDLDQRQWAARANAGLASAHLALGHRAEACPRPAARFPHARQDSC
jgi:tetratricopeptide (TPR) repeat protein